MKKIRVDELILVEGRYDAAALQNLVDGLILTTDGFGIFKNEEKKDLIRTLGRQRGVVILTDSDSAGFKIRSYVEKLLQGSPKNIHHAYIPEQYGKEKRKAAPAKEGLLGVEGMPPEVLQKALRDAGLAASSAPEESGEPPIDYRLLYELGLSGTPGSAERRMALLRHLGLPVRLSKRALVQVLQRLYGRAKFTRLAGEFNPAHSKTCPPPNPAQEKSERPVLFWDFHGTLTLPDITWFDCAMEAAAELAPRHGLRRETLEKHFTRNCLTWFTIESGDIRHLAGPGLWWAYCEEEFRKMFIQCGLPPALAPALAQRLHEKALEPHRYRPYPGAAHVLKELSRRGYQSFILSNNIPELEAIVQAIGLSPYLSGVFSSANLGYDKPNREIFRLAHEKAGKPQNPWMIGDNPRDDIQGAGAAGFRTLCLHCQSPSTANAHLAGLADVLAFFP